MSVVVLLVNPNSRDFDRKSEDLGPFSLQEANRRFVRGKYKSDKELRSITPPLSTPDILEIFYEL